jgi:DNA-binding beta-propeller fold protein YncE
MLQIVLACLAASGGESPAGKVVVVAGAGVAGELKEPFGVDFDKGGNLYIVEITNRVRRLDPAGRLEVLAGSGEKGYAGDGGPAPQSQLNGPHHLLVGPDGDLYVADTWNHCIRKIGLKTGVITTVAGTGQKGFSGDGGPAAKAQFGGLYCLAFDPKGERMFVADLDNRRVRAVDLRTGVVSTVAGNGQRGVPQDGAEAKAQPLVDPRAVAVDSKGNVYIVERGGHALRVVDPAGKVRTVAGTGKKGFSGDGGDARGCELNGPKHAAVDADDSVLVADTENHVVRRYLPREGKIVRVAGTGKKGAGGVGGPPEQVELARPHGVYVHASGALYVSDSDNHRVLKIER